MFYQLLAEILASLSKGPPTTKQNVYPAVHCVYSRVKITNESKVVQKYIIFIFLGRSARQCIRLFQKSDPNPQSWTSHLLKHVSSASGGLNFGENY
jgi:hypothetical protein